MTDTEMVKKPSFWMAAKYRLALVAVTTMGLVGMVSAEINLSGISEMIVAFTGIIPDLMDLILAVLPMVFVLAFYSFILGLLAAILGLIKFNF
jgi:hypothetical protein